MYTLHNTEALRSTAQIKGLPVIVFLTSIYIRPGLQFTPFVVPKVIKFLGLYCYSSLRMAQEPKNSHFVQRELKFGIDPIRLFLPKRQEDLNLTVLRPSF